MENLFVVNNPKDWALEIPGVEIVAARSYLTDPKYGTLRRVRVFNINRSYRYQSVGYYVSLLAAARGHRPIPSVSSIQQMKSQALVRLASEELHELIQKSLSQIQSDEFVLSVYFGRNLAKRYDKLAWALFNEFSALLMRAQFQRKSGIWELTGIRPISASDIPESHVAQLQEFAEFYFNRPRQPQPRHATERFDLAILSDEEEDHAPSDSKALAKFKKAGERLGFYVEFITREDYGRLAEFDALFIRETTNVLHHTYRFAERAQGQGLVVLDDPESILRCTNKVFLAELMQRHRIPIPETHIIHRQNIDAVKPNLTWPCILKQPDSSFSQGVFKAKCEAEFDEGADRLLDKSDLIIAQEFIPTDFDWRIGIIDRKVLYACRYFMARKEWKIAATDAKGKTNYGKVEAVPVEEVPQKVIQTALKAANLIGDGLYGVDLKQVGSKVYIIEVNDNPSIDAGYEDGVVKDELYNTIMEIFLQRILREKELPTHE